MEALGARYNESRGVAEPTVSVVVPTFNRQHTLVAAIASALSQDGATVEVIVLDDSADGSARAAVTSFDDGRVRYVPRATPSNGMPAIARNEGLALARGRFVQFLDDDDFLVDGALPALVDALECNPATGVAIGTVVPFGDDPRVLEQQQQYFADATERLRANLGRRGLVAALLFGPTLLVNSSCLVRRSCANAVGGYSTDVPRCEDVEFFLRAIRRCGYVFVDRPVLRYRTGAPSLMHSLGHESPLLELSYRAIFRRYRREHGVVEYLQLKALDRWQRWRAPARPTGRTAPQPDDTVQSFPVA